ncbi:hypothetical protein [Asticcacaulis benevestitus]|uniref:hypothetical protein n=1 Tax=Asticcacaulis benevestitus TaxID=347481 RepID=UPI0012DE4947|nr:hypothetical protein [Asticcacaulis benevestitus]
MAAVDDQDSSERQGSTPTADLIAEKGWRRKLELIFDNQDFIAMLAFICAAIMLVVAHKRLFLYWRNAPNCRSCLIWAQAR